MATLSGKTTDGRLSFTKYVEQNARFKEVVFEVEAKMEAMFFELKSGKYQAKEKLLKAGTQFNIIENKLFDPNGLKLAKVKLGSLTGFIQISKIRKPTGGNGTQYEDEVVDAINAFILENGGKVDIKVGNKIYEDMAYAIKVDSTLKRQGGVKGDPKADIIVCRDKKMPLVKDSIYISHKKEGGPEAFQQYGGLSIQAGEDINKHKEVQSFLKKVADLIGDGDKLPNPVMMMIKDKNLMNMSIYGPDYGKDFSLQHTQLIGQGKPVFKKVKENVFSLDFSSHMSLSGDLSHFVGGYLPVFGATFRAGRGFDYKNKRYDGARVAIYPHKLMATRGNLIVL